MNARASTSAMRRRGLALTAALALLAGCASMAPTYERPAAPVAPNYPGEEAASSVAAQPAAEIDWRRFFTDAPLRQLIEQALANNRDLRVAVLNIEQARAQYRIRRADRWPTVNAGLAFNRQPNGEGGISETYSAGLQVAAYELDLFGRVASLSDAALARFFATEEARKAAQISLVASVADAYLGLLADAELLELTQQTLATREASLQLTQLKFKQGVSSALDLRQAQSLVESARATSAQLQRQQALDRNLLSLLVGQPVSPPTPAPGALAGLALGSELPAGLPSELLTRRPDIRQAEQALIAANADIGAARAAFFPRITLTGSVGSASSELSGLFAGGSYAWTFAPQLLQPIFDAGRNRANLAASEAGRGIAVAQYEKAIQTAFREVADALAGRATYGDELRAQDAQAQAELARFELSDMRYRNGVASYLDVLDAQRSLFAVQQAVIQVRLASLQNQVALYRSLGGGWTEAAVR